VRKLTMQDAVSQLSDRDRELIALRYGADLTARHIAELLSLSPHAVEVALHRAIERLGQALDRS
jgi:RNA polymerase sigma factor (sigma-70 family)